MKHYTILLFITLSSIVQAQKEYHKWYFGDEAGIDFVSGAAVPLTNGAMYSTDNPATISDSVGNLLFYSNGLEVWNRNHTIMPNGSGLMGNNTAGHTATIIRKPGSTNLYFLFTLDAFAGAYGLRYSVVDMNLNGGLGDVVSGQKNIVVVAPCSEQVVPVKHANNTDVWIVTHPWSNSSFSSYLVTNAGISSTPVSSAVGFARSGAGDNALGQITVNETNNRIAWALYGNSRFELFDFNNATGILSNPLSFPNYTNAWGVEFSPDGSKLYLTGWTTQYVRQFDLTTYTQPAINASVINLGNVTGPGAPYYTGYLQRAPDGKIYLAVYLDPYLAVINNPNAAGVACNLVDDDFNLSGKKSGAGLPDKVVVTYSCNLQVHLGNDTSFCPGGSVTLNAGSAGSTYQWQDNSTNPTYAVTAQGTYSVTVTDNNGCTASDTVNVTLLNPSSFSLGNDTTYCGNFNRVLSTGSATTQWSTGVTASQITVSTAGTYWAYDSNACYVARDTIVIAQLAAPTFSLPNDTSLCAGDSVQLSITAPGNIIWSNSSTASFIWASTPGVYWAQVTNAQGCARTDSIVITQDQIALLNLGADTTFCSSSGFVLRPGIAGAQYVWNDNSTDSFYVVMQSGSYSVTATNGCGSATDNINITYLPNGCQLAIPTAFSPNGDGKNDLFRAISYCVVPKFTMRVYNRWGELVFETNDITEGWNGVFRNTQQPMGVFVYYIEYFNSCSQKKETVAGNVTLLR